MPGPWTKSCPRQSRQPAQRRSFLSGSFLLSKDRVSESFLLGVDSSFVLDRRLGLGQFGPNHPRVLFFEPLIEVVEKMVIVIISARVRPDLIGLPGFVIL